MATTVDIETLRVELKIWEKNFTDDNNGRKPTRQEIKANPTINAKYRQYNQLCRRAPPPPTRPDSTPSKRLRPRQEAPPSASTPRKPAVNTTFSPSKVAPEPEPEPEPTPAFIRSALGPTPQKDGHVLGIFDLLSSGGTPSKPTPIQIHDANDTVAATPSKPSLSSTSGISRTPQSSSKRFYLETFVGTPLTLKRKREESDLGPGASPSTARKLQDATPSFLRRSTFPLGTIEEDRPRSGLFKRPPIRKSLSSVIRGMRQKEEQRMQDDWDVLDELEAEARGEAPPPRAAANVVQVEDAQQDMPLGPDQGAPSSEDEETAPLGRDGLPRKAWKKKGLKRQTRRVKMKPVLHKPGKAAELEDVAEDSGEEGGEVVAETQERDGRPRAVKQRKRGQEDEDGGSRDDSGSNYGDEKDDEDDEEDAMPASPSKVRQIAKPPPAAKPANEAPTKPDNILKKAGKKVAATAHANFRRLNIKNKNSKAKGRGGRFGKR